MRAAALPAVTFWRLDGIALAPVGGFRRYDERQFGTSSGGHPVTGGNGWNNIAISRRKAYFKTV
jgi:hypothetical protein